MARGSKVKIDTNLLRELYLTKKIGMWRIAKIMNVSRGAIYSRLIKLGIQTRKQWGGHGENREVGLRRKDTKGYIFITLAFDDFFALMATKQGRILEHRFVMAKHLGRCLQSWEIVHHKNHIRDDNRIENLQLVSDIGHKQLSFLEGRIEKLEKEVRLLRWQISELNKNKMEAKIL